MGKHFAFTPPVVERGLPCRSESLLLAMMPRMLRSYVLTILKRISGKEEEILSSRNLSEKEGGHVDRKRFAARSTDVCCYLLNPIPQRFEVAGTP